MLNSLKNDGCLFIFQPSTCLYNHTTNPNHIFLCFSQFSPTYTTSPFFQKPIPAIPTNTPFLYTLAIFHQPILTYSHPLQSPPKFLSPNLNIQPIQATSRTKWATSMDMDNSTHNHWFLIAQTQKMVHYK